MSDLLQKITQAAGRHKRAQRIGRGEGSKGKTSGRGQKGAGSRAGRAKRIGFEGGQTEAYRRFPQRGFSNKPFETKYHVINLADLDRFDEGTTVDVQALKQAGLIPNTHLAVKVLGNGSLVKKLSVVAAAFSRSAHKAITEAGGEAQGEDGQPYQFREPKNRRQAAKLDKRLAKLGLPARETGQEAKSEQGEEEKPSRKSSRKAPSSQTDGASGEVTEAPESGEKRAAGESRGRSRDDEGDAGDAPESGEKE